MWTTTATRILCVLLLLYRMKLLQMNVFQKHFSSNFRIILPANWDLTFLEDSWTDVRTRKRLTVFIQRRELPAS